MPNKHSPLEEFFHFLIICIAGAVMLLALFVVESKADSLCEAYRPKHVFQLMGFHLTSACACTSCHLKAVFKGTPTTCVQCHNGSRPPAIGPSMGHIPTGLIQCSECHNTGSTSFGAGVAMSHNSITAPPGGCETCHNGAYTSQGTKGAKGKPTSHIPTTSSCDACHTTANWTADFNHAAAGVILGSGVCATCHNNQYALGLSMKHIPTGGSACDSCHKTFSTFRSGIYAHTGVEACETCHNGQYTSSGAIGKPIDHPLTQDTCTDCHSITGWPCRTGFIETLKRWLS